MVWKPTARQPAQGHQRKMTAWPRPARARRVPRNELGSGGTLQRTTRVERCVRQVPPFCRGCRTSPRAGAGAGAGGAGGAGATPETSHAGLNPVRPGPVRAGCAEHARLHSRPPGGCGNGQDADVTRRERFPRSADGSIRARQPHAHHFAASRCRHAGRLRDGTVRASPDQGGQLNP